MIQLQQFTTESYYRQVSDSKCMLSVVKNDRLTEFVALLCDNTFRGTVSNQNHPDQTAISITLTQRKNSFAQQIA
jgi:hypothetical protein